MKISCKKRVAGFRVKPGMTDKRIGDPIIAHRIPG